LPPIDHKQKLEQFLVGVEKRAFRMAQISTHNHADALDLVQEAMMSLVEKYANKPAEEWPPLFYRILHNEINSWHRKQMIRNQVDNVIHLFRRQDDEAVTSNSSIIDNAEDSSFNPERQVEYQYDLRKIEHALQQLPRGQQQAFFLRNWEGLSTQQTAEAMNCSQSTVKTQYARAMNQLKSLINGSKDDDR